jgi:NTP pyrophosphatase (non-canonical NTP hydrolase)
MNINEFQNYCSHLSSSNFQTGRPEILHAVMGIAGEGGELIDILKKHMAYQTPLDMNHIKEECGDVLHYLAMLATSCGWTLEEVADANKAKLDIRYPNGFTRGDAILRRDKK